MIRFDTQFGSHNARYVNQRKAAIQNLMKSELSRSSPGLGRFPLQTSKIAYNGPNRRKWRVLNRLSSTQWLWEHQRQTLLFVRPSSVVNVRGGLLRCS